jgi:tRNA G10  N-methylase Trm11
VRERWNADMDADRFRIDVHDPSRRCASTTIEIATALADVIPFGPDLRDPLHRFLVIIGEDGFTFGAVRAEADGSYRRHDDKPWTTSSSLDSRFARALVNLVPDATSILDPCCGAGSIVLEAASLGLEAFGVDWKPALAGMTRENLAHFGYDASVELADSRTHVQPADAIVTDLPYGHAIESDEHEIRAILEQSASQAASGVFVAPADISTWLTSAGYTDIEVHTVLKRRGFTRWIHVVRSKHAPRI